MGIRASKACVYIFLSPAFHISHVKDTSYQRLDELCRLSKAPSWVTVHRGMSYRWLFNPSSLTTVNLPQEYMGKLKWMLRQGNETRRGRRI